MWMYLLEEKVQSQIVKNIDNHVVFDVKLRVPTWITTPHKQNNNFWRNPVIVSQMVIWLSLLLCLDLMQTTRPPLLNNA